MQIIEFVDMGHGKRRVNQMLAVQACQRILEAYRSGKENGGSIDWNDIDEAHDMACLALGIKPSEEQD